MHHAQVIFDVHVKNDEIQTSHLSEIAMDGQMDITYFKIPHRWGMMKHLGSGHQYTPIIKHITYMVAIEIM